MKAITRPADGYTVFVGSNSTLAVNVALFKSLPYDPVADFTPLTMMMRSDALAGAAHRARHQRAQDAGRADCRGTHAARPAQLWRGFGRLPADGRAFQRRGGVRAARAGAGRCAHRNRGRPARLCRLHLGGSRGVGQNAQGRDRQACRMADRHRAVAPDPRVLRAPGRRDDAGRAGRDARVSGSGDRALEAHCGQGQGRAQ